MLPLSRYATESLQHLHRRKHSFNFLSDQPHKKKCGFRLLEQKPAITIEEENATMLRGAWFSHRW
jgi:hypothetical protein